MAYKYDGKYILDGSRKLYEFDGKYIKNTAGVSCMSLMANM